MKNVIESERLPIKLWLDALEPDTLVQAKNLANLPSAFHHIAIMADAHLGYGMPIGGVLATKGTIIPNAVGVDIGCGICAVQTGLAHIEPPVVRKVLGGIRKHIPLGFKHHAKARPEKKLPELPRRAEHALPIIAKEFASARKQVGTLGGGNHFIELQLGSDSRVWIMVHSGSRNLGYKVANAYNKKAIDHNQRSGNPIPKNWQLAFLPLDSDLGKLYQREMTYCVDFARASRADMMSVVVEMMADITGCDTFSPPFDVAHNYAASEDHFGETVMVHRKGATRAFSGERGIIPGSQGSYSYIVRGLGNPESFHSCSHGAGRVLGRKQAQKTLDLNREMKKLDDRNIIHAIRHRRDLEEAPGAYKDISTVMACQQDLVEILVELTPLGVIKG